MQLFLFPLALAATAFAQGISIASPADGTTLTAGDPTNVELDFPVCAISPQYMIIHQPDE
jgi:hypothetical protein